MDGRLSQQTGAWARALPDTERKMCHLCCSCHIHSQCMRIADGSVHTQDHKLRIVFRRRSFFQPRTARKSWTQATAQTLFLGRNRYKPFHLS
jgi:hypothetical protein